MRFETIRLRFPRHFFLHNSNLPKMSARSHLVVFSVLVLCICMGHAQFFSTYGFHPGYLSPIYNLSWQKYLNIITPNYRWFSASGLPFQGTLPYNIQSMKFVWVLFQLKFSIMITACFQFTGLQPVSRKISVVQLLFFHLSSGPNVTV